MNRTKQNRTERNRTERMTDGWCMEILHWLMLTQSPKATSQSLSSGVRRRRGTLHHMAGWRLAPKAHHHRDAPTRPLDDDIDPPKKDQPIPGPGQIESWIFLPGDDRAVARTISASQPRAKPRPVVDSVQTRRNGNGTVCHFETSRLYRPRPMLLRRSVSRLWYWGRGGG